jgi:hypothetical protein
MPRVKEMKGGTCECSTLRALSLFTHARFENRQIPPDVIEVNDRDLFGDRTRCLGVPTQDFIETDDDEMIHRPIVNELFAPPSEPVIEFLAEPAVAIDLAEELEPLFTRLNWDYTPNGPLIRGVPERAPRTRRRRGTRTIFSPNAVEFSVDLQDQSLPSILLHCEGTRRQTLMTLLKAGEERSVLRSPIVFEARIEGQLQETCGRWTCRLLARCGEHDRLKAVRRQVSLLMDYMENPFNAVPLELARERIPLFLP